MSSGNRLNRSRGVAWRDENMTNIYDYQRAISRRSRERRNEKRRKKKKIPNKNRRDIINVSFARQLGAILSTEDTKNLTTGSYLAHRPPRNVSILRNLIWGRVIRFCDSCRNNISRFRWISTWKTDPKLHRRRTRRSRGEFSTEYLR